jgi:hypothetical protein
MAPAPLPVGEPAHMHSRIFSAAAAIGSANPGSRRGPQQRNGLAAKQFVRPGHFVDRRTPIEHRQEISGADRSALLDDILCHVLGRAGDELVVAEGESLPAWTWPSFPLSLTVLGLLFCNNLRRSL